MAASPQPHDDQRVARALGLKTPVFRHLKAAFARGENPAWLRCGDPVLAGTFPNAFGFEVLCDRFAAGESLERRRANLLRLFEGKEKPEIEAAIQTAADEGELEDLSLAAEPSPAPEGFAAPEDEAQRAFLERLRGDVGLARDVRRIFREKGTVEVVLLETKGVNTRPFAPLAGTKEPILSVPAARYLQLRRGEHVHALKLSFEMPAREVRALFEQCVEGTPPQEAETFFRLFQEFIERERLPRLSQEARARLKRNAENVTLQQAWNQLEIALDRGRHDGGVLGLCVVRGQKLMAALVSREGQLLRSAALPVQGAGLPDRVAEFVGGDAPTLLAMQADSPTRSAAHGILERLRGAGRVRAAPVPVTVVRTMLREVARRPDETHLTHDERQAVLVARLAWHPRAAAYHTPHVVRAYIPYRGEINPHRLERFELSYLRSMLQERGVDLNQAQRDELRLIPGLEADEVLYERSTAPFRSLEDFQARMGLPETAWRAAACYLRLRGGEEPLDARPLHPFYYPVLRRLAAAREVPIPELLKEPARVAELDWEPVLEERRWPKNVLDLIRSGLSKPGRRMRRPARAQVGQRLEALEVGSTLRGTVSSLLPYGAFVDVGARREGLVHISELADRFVKDPAEVVQVGQEVTVRVLSVDVENQRFRLSMRTQAEKPAEEGGARGSGGARGAGGRGRSGAGGGRPGRPDGRRGQPAGPRGGRRGEGRPRREKEWVGPDPRAGKKEEIDPTNPFYQFFKKNKVVAKSGGDAAAPEEGEEAESPE